MNYLTNLFKSKPKNPLDGVRILKHAHAMRVVFFYPGEEGAEDPIGPENEYWVEKEVDSADQVVAAWGAHPFAKEQAERILTTLSTEKKPSYCLGKTKGGFPRHPLYVKGNTFWERFK